MLLRLADLWAQEGIPFVLGHALDMKAIHGGKAKNDTIDAHNIAVLLRGGMRPQVYVYPAALRATRDLLRRRMYWAFSEAAVLFLRDHPAGQKYRTRLEKNHGKGKAWTVLAHQLARAVY